LGRLLSEHQNILLLGPRRVGKTSLTHELRRSPIEGWTFFYSDLERFSSPGELVADMIAHLIHDKRTRNWLDVAAGLIPFRQSIANAINRIKTFSFFGTIRVDIAEAIGAHWRSTAEKLQRRLAHLPPDAKLVFIHDELSILVSKILQKENGVREAEALLGWLRSLRQDPALLGKILFIAGGSISLDGVLRRHGMSASINDFAVFCLDVWSQEIARDFLIALGKTYSLPLTDSHISEMLKLLGDPVPYHVQLMFQTVHDLSEGHPERITVDLIEQAFNERLAGRSGAPHLAHYAERLVNVLDQDDLVIARKVLRSACRSVRGIRRSAITISTDQEGKLHAVVDLLIEDGYLRASGETLQFRSNLLREYWHRFQRKVSTP
jgi:uncharacterized protein